MKHNILFLKVAFFVSFVLFLIQVGFLQDKGIPDISNILIGVIGGLVANSFVDIVSTFIKYKKATKNLINNISNLGNIINNYRAFLIYVTSIEKEKRGFNSDELAFYVTTVFKFNNDIAKIYNDIIFTINDNFFGVNKYLLYSFAKDLMVFYERIFRLIPDLYVSTDSAYWVFENLKSLRGYFDVIVPMKTQVDDTGKCYSWRFKTSLGDTFIYYAKVLDELLKYRRDLVDYFYFMFCRRNYKNEIKNKVLGYLVKSSPLENDREGISILENVLYSKGFRFGENE